MLHIKDIEAFASINEALFRTPGTPEGEGARAPSEHPAVALARLMAAAQAPAPPDETAADEPAERPAEPPMTMARLFSRMMFGGR